MTGSLSSCRRILADLKIRDLSRGLSAQFIFEDGLELMNKIQGEMSFSSSEAT